MPKLPGCPLPAFAGTGLPGMTTYGTVSEEGAANKRPVRSSAGIVWGRLKKSRHDNDDSGMVQEIEVFGKLANFPRVFIGDDQIPVI